MTATMTFCGLDVHANQTHGAALTPATGELTRRRIAGPPEAALDWLERLGSDLLAVYEAGPTGFALAREARQRGIDLRIAAPGLIPRGPTDRVKTDRKDAERLARLLAAGELRFAYLPTPSQERFRDLVRAREDLRGDLMRSRHRLSKLLLRRGLRYPGPGKAWTQRRRRVAARARLRRRGHGADLPRLPGRGRRPHPAPRHPRPGDRAPLAREPLRPGDRPAALLSRHRQPLGGRDLRRAGRLSPLQAAQPGCRLPGDDPV